MWITRHWTPFFFFIITICTQSRVESKRPASEKAVEKETKLDDDYSRSNKDRYPSYSDHVDRLDRKDESRGNQKYGGYGGDHSKPAYHGGPPTRAYGTSPRARYGPTKSTGGGKPERREGYGSPRDTVYGGPTRAQHLTDSPPKRNSYTSKRRPRPRKKQFFNKANWPEPEKEFPKNDWNPDKDFKSQDWENENKSYKKPDAKSWGYGYSDYDDDVYHRGYGVTSHKSHPKRDNYLDFDLFDKHDRYHDSGYDRPRKHRTYHPRPHPRPHTSYSGLDVYDPYDRHDRHDRHSNYHDHGGGGYHDSYSHGYDDYYETQCYQCAYSPPDVTYKTIKIPVESYSPYSADAYGEPHVDYITKRVAVRTDGGWDRCMGPFSHTQAKYHGINVYGCKNNCYVRVDYNGNLYRGCYKGEYRVNPHRLGCHYQADSLYCFCHGDKCNNGSPPKLEDHIH